MSQHCGNLSQHFCYTIISVYYFLEDQKNRDHFGVVQTADFNNRTCSIRWLQFVNDVYESAGHTEEHVSVYDVADHKDYSFRAGDVVVRLATANEPEVNNEGISVPPAGEVFKYW